MPKKIGALARAQVVERDGFACRYCSRRVYRTTPPEALIRMLTFDHVIPSSRGGSGGVGNVVVACWECNHAKGDAMPEGRWTPLPVPAAPPVEMAFPSGGRWSVRVEVPRRTGSSDRLRPNHPPTKKPARPRRRKGATCFARVPRPECGCDTCCELRNAEARAVRAHKRELNGLRQPIISDEIVALLVDA